MLVNSESLNCIQSDSIVRKMAQCFIGQVRMMSSCTYTGFWCVNIFISSGCMHACMHMDHSVVLGGWGR